MEDADRSWSSAQHLQNISALESLEQVREQVGHTGHLIQVYGDTADVDQNIKGGGDDQSNIMQWR